MSEKRNLYFLWLPTGWGGVNECFAHYCTHTGIRRIANREGASSIDMFVPADDKYMAYIQDSNSICRCPLISPDNIIWGRVPASVRREYEDVYEETMAAINREAEEYENQCYGG